MQPIKPALNLATRVLQPGNTLSEYALIGLFILLGCIVALTSLGTSLSTGFLGMVPAPSKGQAVAAPPSTLEGPKPSSLASGGQSIAITLSNGSTIQISGHSQDLSATVETLGANGATDMLANTIQAMADQMLANGTISTKGHAHLTALSNQAHYIASIEKALEEAAAKATTSEQFRSTPIQFDGKTHTAQELRMLVGYGNGSHDPNAVMDRMNDPSAYPAVKTFQALFRQATQGDALEDPVALQTVQTLSEQIALLSELSTIATVKIITADLSPSDMIQHIASDASHEKSGGICNIGNGKDNGVKCSD